MGTRNPAEAGPQVPRAEPAAPAGVTHGNGCGGQLGAGGQLWLPWQPGGDGLGVGVALTSPQMGPPKPPERPIPGHFEGRYGALFLFFEVRPESY